jgi:hypothetical protein
MCIATNLNSETLDIVQAINETLHISSVPELCRGCILLENCLISIVVSRVAVDKSVKEECIDWEPPIRGR